MGAGASVPYEFMTFSPKIQDQLKHEYDHAYHVARQTQGMDELSARKQAELSIKLGYMKEKIHDHKKIVVPLNDLETAVSLCVAQGKTPLIIDPSENDTVNSFYMYKTVTLLDASKLALDKSLMKVPIADLMEGARSKLVSSIKLGRPLVIALGKSACDFATTYHDGSEEMDASCVGRFFPLEVFKNAGKGLLSEENMRSLFREGDLENGVARSGNQENFYVVVTSQFTSADYQDYLFGNDWGLPKPIENYQVIVMDDTKVSHVMTAEEVAALPLDDEVLQFAQDKYVSLFDDDLQDHHDDVLNKVNKSAYHETSFIAQLTLLIPFLSIIVLLTRL